VTTSQPNDQRIGPLPLDEIHCDDFYGVLVSALGEAGEQVGYVAFTTDRRRALAAVNAVRRTEGESSSYLDAETFGYVQVFEHCGCPPHEVDEDGDHSDCDCPHWGLPPCHDELYSFAQQNCSPDALNALPAFWLKVSA
jgi:hypothetical protein